MGRKATLQKHQDAALIEKLGGPTMAAKVLGITGPHAQQRVSNWRTRGIPAEVKPANYNLLVRKAAKAVAA